VITPSVIHTHTHTYWVVLLWKEDRPVAKACTWQHTTDRRQLVS